jgi:hypothetical protein
MIEKTIENWHKLLRGEFEGGLDAILADDVVFYSPIVFSPQEGRAVAKMYLEAAFATLAGDSEAGSADAREKQETKKFRYAKEVLSGNHAFLEFETYAAGKYINGVDIITCNDAGLISEFKVMIRPLQAVNLLHEQMAAMLAKMQG